MVNSISGLLVWDQSVNLGPDGFDYRGEQLAFLNALSHEKATAPEIGAWLSTIENGNFLEDSGPEVRGNMREIRRQYDRAVKVPAALVMALSRARSAGERAWLEARKLADFSIFLPRLQTLLELSKELADAIGYAHARYDVMLDEYEPGVTADQLSQLFDRLRSNLVPLVEAVVGSTRQPDESILCREFAVASQQELCNQVLAAIGFDTVAGRLDTSEHPFTSGIAPGDTRLTTKYDPRDFRVGFFGMLHEAGHGLYYQGLVREHFGLPQGTCGYNGLHEAQARLWENAVGRSRSFWRYWYPRAQDLFPQALNDVRLDDFLRAINQVKKSFIRVDADELTYNLHVFLRFDLEKKLFSSALQPADIPDAWNESFQSLFGLTITDANLGCLQDMHWSRGAFGYFPTYTLGNVYGAQLFAAARTALKDLDQQFDQGNFVCLTHWLAEKIHRLGQTYPGAELVERVTGSKPSPQALIDQLTEKFSELYRL